VEVEALLWGLLATVIFPLWLLVGVVDYAIHARTDLVHTSGARESALHLLQTAEIAVPVLLLLFLEVTALTVALMIAGALAHSVTAYRDIHYAQRLRHMPAIEQLAHAFLIVLPLASLAVVIVLHWPMATAMLQGTGAPPGAWALRWREPGFDPRAIAAVLSASVLFGVVPGVIEFVRSWRHRGRTRPGDPVRGAPSGAGAITDRR